MPITFRDNPNTTLPELQREVKRVVEQIKEPVVIKNVTIGTGATPIAHGLGFVPRTAVLVPYELVTWCRAGAPTDRVVFFKASAETKADVVVFL